MYSVMLVPLVSASGLLSDCNAFVQNELVTSATPESVQLLAEAITGLEYYLERESEPRAFGTDAILMQVTERVTHLGYLGRGTAVVQPVEETAEVEPLEQIVSSATGYEAEELIEFTVDKASSDTAEKSATSPDDELELFDLGDPAFAEISGMVETAAAEDEEVEDEDISAVFAEEAEEILQAFEGSLEIWSAAPTDSVALNEVRRGFHTLKGSGRMVGAEAVGELTWSIENMLNRMLEGTVGPSSAAVTLVNRAVALLPDLMQAFVAGTAPDMDAVSLLTEQADLVASGQEPDIDDEPLAEGNASVTTYIEVLDDEDPGSILENVLPLDDADLELIDFDEPAVREAAATTPGDLEHSLVSLEDADAPFAGTEAEEELRIFLDEAADYLRLLEVADQADLFVVDSSTIRALHTLCGSADMIGVAPVSAIARPVYDMVRVIDKTELNPQQQAKASEILRNTLTCLRQTLAGLGGTGEVPESSAIARDAEQLVLEISNWRGVDQLLMISGSGDILEGPAFITAWQADQLDHEIETRLFAGLEEIQRVADENDAIEVASLAIAIMSAHTRIREQTQGPLAQSNASVLSEGYEFLARLFDELAGDMNPSDPSDIIARLDRTNLSASAKVVSFPSAEMRSTDVVAQSSTPQRADQPDPELIDIFMEEANDLLENMDEQIHVWSANAQNPDALPALLRNLHTLKGSARLAGVYTVGDTAHQIETDLIAFRDSAASADAGLFDSLYQDHELLQTMLACAVEGDAVHQAIPVEDDEAGGYEDPSQPLPLVEVDEALTTLELVHGRDPADLDIADTLDSDITEIFFEEADEILEELEASINSWTEASDNRLYLEDLLRGLHTLKGGARLAGLIGLGQFTHEFETSLIEVQASTETVGKQFFTSLCARFDELSSLVRANRRAVSARVPTVDATQTVEQPGVPAKPADSTAPASQASAAQDTTASEVKGSQEMVRVGATLLEELVNLAGESSILRARIEQGMGDFTAALDEMEMTISRVREQLRRLEMETEAQVLFRKDRLSGPEYDDFDPLELDRYSQLQQLSRSLTESASDMLDLKETLLYKARASESLLVQQARVNTELQEGLMRTRMSPFNRVLPRLRRLVRQSAAELGKEVGFHAYNAEGEMDRNLLERIVPALEHMLRNAVDHGIESDRLAAGKPTEGRIDLHLSREGGDVVIEISDDGAGINVNVVRKKAIERGLMKPDARLSEEEIIQFVLAPGFSTASSVTQISGRGVGMDVVHSGVKQLGGSIGIFSRRNKGTRIVLRLPFTVSVNRSLMVSVGDDLYALPLNTIEGIVLLTARELNALHQPDAKGFEYAGIPYRVRYLGDYLGREYVDAGSRAAVPVVLVRSGDLAVAVHVDSVQGSREIVVKSLGPQFAGVGGISGATILGDGSVVVILDLLGLIRAQGKRGGVRIAPQKNHEKGIIRVLVVDDSVTVRKVTTRLLERQGMQVTVAKDGVEAMAILNEKRPDVMLLDIEMPRMDGFEVARQVRHDERLHSLPIIMISSRTGEKHKEHVFQLGVNKFMGKPFQESELLESIDELVNS